jgi:DNA repair exonuclease SbcCD ATPase subunit
MLKLNKLRFGNVGRFVSPQEVDFSTKKQLVQINGVFVDTGGSSGAGKSTLIEMIDYVFGINKSSATTLQSRYTKEPMWAEAEFDSGAYAYTISRIKDKGLKVSWVGPEGEGEISGNVALAEEKIKQVLGLDPDLFRRMTHKAQKEDGFFLSLTPKESFGFLIKVMGMEGMLNKIEKSEQLVSEKEKLVNSIQLELASLGSKVQDQTEIVRKSEAEKLPTQPNLDTLELAKAELAKYLAKAASLDQELENQLSLLKQNEPVRPSAAPISPRLAEIDFEISKLNIEAKALELEKNDKIFKIQKALEGLKAKKNSAEYAGRKAKEIANFISNHNAQLEHLMENNCPTCLQKWLGTALKEKIDTIKGEIESAKAQHDTLTTEHSGIGSIVEQIDRAQAILTTTVNTNPAADVNSKISVLQVEKQNINQASRNADAEILRVYSVANTVHLDRLNSIRSEFDKEKKDTASNIDAVKNVIKTLELEQANYDSSLKSKEKNIAINKEYLNKYVAQLEDKNKEYQKAQSEFLLYQEAKRLFKSYTNKMFEEALETIGRNATERLNKIPNMSTASVYFEPFKEVKGKIKEEVSVVVSMDGDIGIPIKSLSGGERSAADLAVDLAVADFIEEHSGMGANYLILDEPCSGMDTVCKQEYIEMLKTVSTNKQILIVEHSTEVKEMVDDVITVRREGLYSNVVN